VQLPLLLVTSRCEPAHVVRHTCTHQALHTACRHHTHRSTVESIASAAAAVLSLPLPPLQSPRLRLGPHM
jgi:hypothetical protein